jgi:hypothetical protein
MQGGAKPGAKPAKAKAKGKAADGKKLNAIQIPGVAAATAAASAAGQGGASPEGAETSLTSPAPARPEPAQTARGRDADESGATQTKRVQRTARWQQERREALNEQLDVTYPLNPRDRQ